mgnify:CR=1 FL=1
MLTQGHGRNVELLLRQTGSARPGAAGPDFSRLVSYRRASAAICPAQIAPGFATGSICSATSHSSSARSHSGRDSSATFDIGSWTLSSDRRTLTLHGGQERPLMFRIIDPSTLRKLDLDGHDIESELNYSLTRMGQFEAIEASLAMRGMYRHLADAGTFTECLTRQRWLVAQEDR